MTRPQPCFRRERHKRPCTTTNPLLSDNAPNVLPQAASVLGSWSEFWEEFLYNLGEIFSYAWDSMVVLGMDIGSTWVIPSAS